MERVRELAAAAPGKEALRLAGTNEVLTYAILNERADRVAHWLIQLGLQPGDGIALLFENHPALAIAAVGAERAGLYFTPISIQLKTREVAHVLKDCGARVLIVSQAMRELAQTLADEGALHGVACYMTGALPRPASPRSTPRSTRPTRASRCPSANRAAIFSIRRARRDCPKASSNRSCRGIAAQSTTPKRPHGARVSDLIRTPCI
ncbi:AMP-binding protein [Paraburkholderia tropica]|uniref:AMP-binding protein n=1 Tax=Paraburkholderia tropica TaxID=92647 RepID=UPI0023518709|nr:AMP-binding protein [Paraburkholderia tropica]